jgi:hypothetical protein
LAPITSFAAPARAALVIGSATYGSLPPVPACLMSAHAVASALHAAGFQVVERDDPSSGGVDAAIAEFVRQLTASPGASAVVYSCSYITEFNNRPFLLPISARLTRPADVLTQGVLAKTLIDALRQGGAGPSIVAIDAVPAGEGPVKQGLDSLIQMDLPDGLGLIAVSQARPPDAPTPLATALASGLKGAEVRSAPLLADLQQQLGGKPMTLAAVRPPIAPGYLVGAAPPPPTPPKPAPVQPAAVAPAAPPPPTIAMPPDELMNEFDRRTIQQALQRLGYYPGPIDGIFGSDSRAAIRRYQHELGDEMTGRLSAAEASRLANAH